MYETLYQSYINKNHTYNAFYCINSYCYKSILNCSLRYNRKNYTEDIKEKNKYKQYI